MPASIRAIIRRRMKDGGFNNASEYFRHLVREDDKSASLRKLENLLREGLESGPPVEMDAADWASIRTEARARLRRRKSA